MQPWWNFSVELFPIWMAPNLITLSAVFFTVASILQFAPYDASATMEFPMWTGFFSAFCVFMYQTFDAVDGKQARRTK
jgi:phosphatidylglycerophosphate synthase